MSTINVLKTVLSASDDGFSKTFAEATISAKQFNEILKSGEAIYQATRTPLELYETELNKIQAAFELGAINQETLNRAVTAAQAEYKHATRDVAALAAAEKKAAEEQKAMKAAQDAVNATMARGKAVTDALRTPFEKYEDDVRDLNGLLKAGAISQETFNRAMSKMEQSPFGAAKSTNMLTSSLSKMVPVFDPISLALKVLSAGFDLAKDAAMAFADVLVTSVAAGIERIDALDDAAAKLGVTTEALSSLRYAVGFAGVEAGTLDKALAAMAINLDKAAESGKGVQPTLERIGLDAKALRAAGPEKAFAAIADAIAKIEDPATRARVASDLFGKSGKELTGILAQGGDAFRAAAAEADAFGLRISSLDAAKVAEAADATERLGKMWEGVQNTLAIELAPIITGITKQLIDMGVAGGSIGEQVKFGVDVAVNSLAGLMNALDLANRARNFDVLNDSPLAGNKMLAEIDKARQDAERNAAEAVRNRKNTGTPIDMENIGNDGATTLGNTPFDRAAEQLRDSLRTPLEVLQDELTKFGDMFAAGAIDVETLNRAIEKAEADFEKTVPKRPTLKELPAPLNAGKMQNNIPPPAGQAKADVGISALDMGSAAAFSAINAARGGGLATGTAADIARKQLEEQKKQRKLQEQIAAGVNRKPKVARF